MKRRRVDDDGPRTGGTWEGSLLSLGDRRNRGRGLRDGEVREVVTTGPRKKLLYLTRPVRCTVAGTGPAGVGVGERGGRSTDENE